ncbi:MAG: CHAT domain-containing protein [Pyrinomonadaceae bacterium]
MSKRFYFPLLAVAFACLVALANVSSDAAATNELTETASNTVDGSAAQIALEQGTSLLRRNRADQSLPLLESALKLFTQANDQHGIAAAHDALGDIYLRHGQFDTAVEHFQRAADAFRAGNETANAALMFAKMGEAHYLAGNEDAARTAFTRVSENSVGDAKEANASGSSGGNGSKTNSNGATFASISASMANLASCPSLNSNNNNSNNTANNAAPGNLTPSNNAAPNSEPPKMANNAAPGNTSPNSEPPNMGHAPKGLDGIGRMDLRLVDQDGNPVKEARARLATKRPNGISCDCWENTGVNGRALLPPIHVGKVLKLEIKAPGFQSFEQIVAPEDLAKPYRVTLQAKNAAKSAAQSAAKAGAQNATQQGQSAATSAAQSAAKAGAQNAMQQGQSAATTAAAGAACFDFYRLFVAFGTSELGLGRADFNKGDLNAAQTRYQNVLVAANPVAPAGNLSAARLFRAVARTSLGDIALRQGRLTDALTSYRQAVEFARQDNRPELMWGAQRGMGKSYLAMAEADPQAAAKNRDEAIKSYRAALMTIETLFAGSLRSDDARINFLATTQDVFDEASSALAEMSLTNTTTPAVPQNQALAHAPDTTNAPLNGQSLIYAGEAFEIVEQGRARSLLDLLGDARAQVTEGIPAALLERKTQNVARQQEIANLLSGVTLKAEAAKQTVPDLEAELEQLTMEFNSLENQIRTSSPRYAALVRTQPLTLAEAQQQVLDDNTVLLVYNLGAERSYLWAATKTGLMLHRLAGRAAIEQQVTELREQMVPAGARRAIASLNDDDGTRGLSGELDGKTDAASRGLVLSGPATATQNVSAYATAANALYQTILAPASASFADKRMLVVADGALNYIPFEALVSSTEGADYSTLSYLVKTNEIVYAPSASVVGVLRRQARSSAGKGLLVVADPVFDAGDARVKVASQRPVSASDTVQRMALMSALADVTSLKAAGLKLSRLGGTRSEAEQIAQLARTSGSEADVWLDFDASEANLRERKLNDYRVLHFATHGLLDAQRPQFTGLALSLVGDANADGLLRVEEVFNLRLGSPLVMLSACETGLGKEKRGEGVIGLTRAFIYAGAPTVGVSLWSVADKSTAELMPEFYRRLLAGQSGAPAAMRAAQNSMIAGKRYSAPFYWAPFVLVGDWR